MLSMLAFLEVHIITKTRDYFSHIEGLSLREAVISLLFQWCLLGYLTSLSGSTFPGLNHGSLGLLSSSSKMKIAGLGYPLMGLAMSLERSTLLDNSTNSCSAIQSPSRVLSVNVIPSHLHCFLSSQMVSNYCEWDPWCWSSLILVFHNEGFLQILMIGLKTRILLLYNTVVMFTNGHVSWLLIMCPREIYQQLVKLWYLQTVILAMIASLSSITLLLL